MITIRPWPGSNKLRQSIMPIRMPWLIRLTAPFDGYIQKKYYDSHETVAAGYPVVSMINSNYFDVDIDIPSSDFVRQDLFKAFFLCD